MRAKRTKKNLYGGDQWLDGGGGLRIFLMGGDRPPWGGGGQGPPPPPPYWETLVYKISNLLQELIGNVISELRL